MRCCLVGVHCASSISLLQSLGGLIGVTLVLGDANGVHLVGKCMGRLEESWMQRYSSNLPRKGNYQWKISDWIQR